MHRLYMRRFVTLRNEEAGGEGAAGGESIDAGSSDVGSQDTGTPAAQSPASDAPKSMLEAIERGLKGEDAAKPADEPAKTADERARDEQGRFAKKAEEDAAAKKAAEAAMKAKEPPGKDGDLPTMPEGLSEKAQHRFRELTHRASEAIKRAEAAEADVTQFREVLRQTGGTAEDFTAAFDYITAMKRGDLQSALSMLDAQRRQISLMMGRPLPGADPLAEFPDLRQRVEAYQMDESAAIELARARKQAEALNNQRMQSQETQQRAQATQQAKLAAMAEVDRMGAEWAARDPDYAAKEEIILKQIPAIAQQFPPQMWAAQVRMLYDTMSSMPMSPPPAMRQATPAPLRPSGQQGGARKPASMLEALNSGLGYGNG